MAAVAAVGAVGGAVVTASQGVGREGAEGSRCDWVGRSDFGSGISVLALDMSIRSCRFKA